MQTHKYFRPFQPAASNSKPQADSDPDSGLNHNKSAALDGLDMTLTKPLPPAGNLIVYDKGKKVHYVWCKCTMHDAFFYF